MERPASQVMDPEIADSRRRAFGTARALILAFGLFGLVRAAQSVVHVIREAPAVALGSWLSLLAAVVYLVAAVALAHNGRRMRRVAWAAIAVELIGVIAGGTLALFEADREATMWSGFGSSSWYVPLVLPILGLAWLWRSAPVRIERLAEGPRRA